MQKLIAIHRMLFDDFPFLRGECIGFGDDALRNHNVPNVMKKSSDTEIMDLFLGEIDHGSNKNGDSGNIDPMKIDVLIMGLKL